MDTHHPTPHFHNEPGLPSVKVAVKEFMCTGALPPFDHPHVFIDMGHSEDAICPYCSTHYLHQASLATLCEPPVCEYRPDTAP